MQYIRNSFVFVLFALAISSCTENSSNTTAAGQNSDGNAVSTGNDRAGAGYPPLSERVAQADMRNLDGSISKIADHKGKVLLLNLWATWCGFCREEMPILVRMQDEHRDAGFEVIGLNVDDESLDQVTRFSEEMKLNYTLVWADGKLMSGFLRISKFDGIPQSFLVDREGNLRGVFTGADPRNLKKMETLVAKVVAE